MASNDSNGPRVCRCRRSPDGVRGSSVGVGSQIWHLLIQPEMTQLPQVDIFLV